MQKIFSNKKFLTFGMLMLVTVLFFATPHTVHAAGSNCLNWETLTPAGGLKCAIEVQIKAIGQAIQNISALILTMTGAFLDKIIELTIIKTSEFLGNSVDAAGRPGLGQTISSTWATLRDIANMFFIFLLIYAALKMMFDSNFGGFNTTIRNIVIAALLINFSLFFTKVVIDASNIVSVGFYNSISTANDYTFGSNSTIQPVAVNSKFVGIAGGYMRLLGLQHWYDPALVTSLNLDIKGVLTVAILSSAFLLVTSVVLLVTAVMFVTRFILLIFIMILSPLAVIAFIIPGTKGYFNIWWDGLKNQALFSPVFFALTWVAFKIGSSAQGFLGLASVMNQGYVDILTKPPTSWITLVVNYVLVMGLAIAALIASKNIASQTTGFKQISSGVGALALGGLGFAGRQTMGRYANKVAGDKNLQEAAARGDRGARMKLATAQSLAGSSFDVRGIAGTKFGKAIQADKIIDTGVVGKAGGEGGYKKTKEFWTRDEARKKRTEEVMKKYRNNPSVLADHLESLSYGDQKTMYDKLSARDRAAVDEALNEKHKMTGGKLNPTSERLRNDLSPEEKEKTEKAAGDAQKARNVTETKKAIDELIAGATPPPIVPGSKTTANPSGIPATFDNLISNLAGKRGLLPTSETNKLSDEALKNPDVIKRLTPKHLADLTKNRDMNDDVRNAIISEVTGTTTYPLQAAQSKYLTSNTEVESIWGI